MGKVYSGGIATPHYYNINAAAPIDNRSVVKTLTDLYDFSTWQNDDENDDNLYLYEGLLVYVEEEKNAYILKDITKYNSAEGWKVAGAEIVNIYDYITDEGLNEEGIDKTAALSVVSGIRLLKEKVGLDPGTGKIPTNLIPDSITSGLLYGGTARVKTNGTVCIESPTQALIDLNDQIGQGDVLDESFANEFLNVFFIVKVIEADDHGYSIGDWLISNGRGWDHIKQANVVTQVCGLTGVVTKQELIGKLTEDNDNKSLELATMQDVNDTTKNMIQGALTWQTVTLPKSE
jgi:hypothetical protein